MLDFSFKYHRAFISLFSNQVAALTPDVHHQDRNELLWSVTDQQNGTMGKQDVTVPTYTQRVPKMSTQYIIY